MKRTISLILALILFCTLPGMFASDDVDFCGHDHDELTDVITHDSYCSTCGYVTPHEYCNVDYYGNPDSGGHWCYTYEQDICTVCNDRTETFIGDAYEGHTMHMIDYDPVMGFVLHECTKCRFTIWE